MGLPQPTPGAGASPSVLVVCLCAEWCGVCRDYRDRFAQVQTKFAQVRFLWIDVEDEADLLEPLDVENFPTILLAVDAVPRFFGPVLPSVDTLERMIRVHLHEQGASRLQDPALADLLGRIKQAHPAP
jgi:thioredoxin 1